MHNDEWQVELKQDNMDLDGFDLSDLWNDDSVKSDELRPLRTSNISGPADLRTTNISGPVGGGAGRPLVGAVATNQGGSQQPIDLVNGNLSPTTMAVATAAAISTIEERSERSQKSQSVSSVGGTTAHSNLWPSWDPLLSNTTTCNKPSNSKGPDITPDMPFAKAFQEAMKSNNRAPKSNRENSGEVSSGATNVGTSSVTEPRLAYVPLDINEAATQYFRGRGAGVHPLALTSNASCPPYKKTNGNSSSTSVQALLHKNHGPESVTAATTSNSSFPLLSQPEVVSSQVVASQAVTSQSQSKTPTASNSIFSAHLSELTSNFAASNQFEQHYGMAVNGFHPQVNAQVNPPVLPLPNTTISQNHTSGKDGTGTGSSPQISGISGSNGGDPSANTRPTGRNAREAERAQKITQLITDLRVHMQEGGWKAEMKSKYQTLNQCKEYIAFLQQSHKAKEAEIAQTRKLVEERAMPCASQPCSVTSNMSDITARSSSQDHSSSSDQGSITSRESQGDNRKRSTSDMTNGMTTPHQSKRPKKDQPDAKAANSSSTESLTSDDDKSPSVKNFAYDKTASSVSDITDSNRSSTKGTASENRSNETSSGGFDDSVSSISSTAAVVRGRLGGSLNSSHAANRWGSQGLKTSSQRVLPSIKGGPAAFQHAQARENVMEVEVKKSSRRRKQPEGHDLNYKEVFLKSRVPQLIASLNGRVVVWNSSFLRATGLAEEDVRNLTIFSIVRSDQLSSVYQMAARALAEKEGGRPGGTPASGVDTSMTEEWESITLNCIPFVDKNKKTGEQRKTHNPNSLLMTVALMEDANDDQRCFHCTLTV